MEKKEKKEIVIKKTAQHTAGTKYLERATEGEINAPVYLRESKGKVEATDIDFGIRKEVNIYGNFFKVRQCRF